MPVAGLGGRLIEVTPDGSRRRRLETLAQQYRDEPAGPHVRLYTVLGPFGVTIRAPLERREQALAFGPVTWS